MPDSGWLKILKDSGPGFFLLLAVAFGAVALVWRYLPGLFEPPFAGAQGWAEAIAISTAAVGAILLGWKYFSASPRAPDWWQRGQLVRRYKRLDQRQKNYLQGVYATQSRSFDADDSVIKLRWFEELVEQGFLRRIPMGVYWAGRTDWPYEITRPAWAVLSSIKTP